MIYRVEPVEDGIVVRYVHDGQLVCELWEGNAAVIGAIYQSLSAQSEQRADDFMTGVVAGIAHCAITASRSP